LGEIRKKKSFSLSSVLSLQGRGSIITTQPQDNSLQLHSANIIGDVQGFFTPFRMTGVNKSTLCSFATGFIVGYNIQQVKYDGTEIK